VGETRGFDGGRRGWGSHQHVYPNAWCPDSPGKRVSGRRSCGMAVTRRSNCLSASILWRGADFRLSLLDDVVNGEA